MGVFTSKVRDVFKVLFEAISFIHSVPLTIIYFLNTKQIKASILSEYYLGLPTTFALLGIPFVFLFEERLTSMPVARKMSVAFAIGSVVLIFSFLIVKNIYVTDTYYTSTSDCGLTNIRVKEANNGEISLSTYGEGGTAPIKEEHRVNALEIASLLLYFLSIIGLTVSFSSLGVFFYTKSA
jgi:hypothetical protein